MAGSPSFEELRAAVDRDAWNFAAWTRLLSFVEAEGARVGATFEEFLGKFPLCFGYWCKYAEMQQDATTALGIYERAVEAVPLSVELWKSYCRFLEKRNDENGGSDADETQRLRETYERAVEAAGFDKASRPLWDAFFEFEATRGSPQTVCRVYRRALAEDGTGRVDELWHRFKLLCRAYKTSELMSPEEASSYLRRYKAEKDAEDDVDRAKLQKLAGYSDLEEQRQLEQMLRETERAKNDLVRSRVLRCTFESGIRRWYFHAKPLDEAQLQNWRNYLAAEIHDAGDDKNKYPAVQRLFERCLVPCALYAEFWVAYALWAHHHLNHDEALSIIARASTKFLPKRLDVLQTLAHFLELSGRIDDARQVHATVSDRTRRSKGGSSASLRCAAAISRANFERRQKNYAATLDAYRECLDDKDDDSDFVATHCARFQVRVLRDVDAARRTLDTALLKASSKPGLWVARVQLEMMELHGERLSVVRDKVCAVYERAVADDSPLPDDSKLDMWARYLYFVENYHDDVRALVDARRRLADFRRERFFDDGRRRPFAPQFPPQKQAPDFWDDDNDVLHHEDQGTAWLDDDDKDLLQFIPQSTAHDSS